MQTQTKLAMSSLSQYKITFITLPRSSDYVNIFELLLIIDFYGKFLTAGKPPVNVSDVIYLI
ncbi:unnamed protein product [Brugia timori]|uniref:Uncharacterized protein n=1 Tax=Brugia timori TaxID=42155 RepID=A0A0R3QL90_9BILA|nr:unnamed protein product [Brugia timori]